MLRRRLVAGVEEERRHYRSISRRCSLGALRDRIGVKRKGVGEEDEERLRQELLDWIEVKRKRLAACIGEKDYESSRLPGVKRRLTSLRSMEQERCYIEALPDEILAHVLSRLETKEVARTCAVSRRWKKLSLGLLTWCKKLDLDFTNKKYKLKHVQKSVAFALKAAGDEVDHLRTAFHDEYLPCLTYAFKDLFLVANAKQVQSLDFEVDNSRGLSYHYAHDSRLCCFPPWIEAALNSWERLTLVSLKSVVVCRVDVEILLSMSPNLETLLLENVPVMGLDVLHDKLKRLEIRNCVSVTSFDTFSVPSLQSLTHIPLTNECCHGMMNTNISVNFRQGAPRLEAITLGGPLCRGHICQAQKNVPQLQKLQLEIDVKCECRRDNGWTYNTTYPTLGNVKQLELRFTCTREDGHDTRQLDTAMAMIHACPCLEKLTLKYEIQEADAIKCLIKRVDECIPRRRRGIGDDIKVDDYGGSNEFLKEVEVVGWSGLESEVQFVCNLIDTSPNLRKLSLDPTPPHQTETSWRGIFGPVQKSDKEMEDAARLAQQLITSRNLVCV